MRGDGKAIDSSGRTVLVAFGVVAAAFILSTAVAERSDVAIRDAARQIAGNAAPSVEQLSLLRSDLRRIIQIGDGDLDAVLEGRPPFARRRIDAALADLRRDWGRYQATPEFPGEATLAAPAARAVDDLGQSLARIEKLDDAGDQRAVSAALENELQPAATRLDGAALRLIDFNAARGAALGREIGALGRRSVINAAVLDTICLALTIAAGFLTWRFGRRYTALLERRAEELEAFAGRVAHDVIGPLSAASLALDLLSRGTAPPDRATRAIEAGRAGIGRARLIADGLLGFARAGARPEPDAHADVAEVIAGAVKEAAPEATGRGIALHADAAHAGVAACNPGVLASLVSNLLRNAIKYAGDGVAPRILIRARTVRERAGRARIRIEVEDNGPGLPPGLGDRVFEPYVRGTRADQPGIGLGLATVKRIAEAHRGRVRVRSLPGFGCTFAVELPVASAPVAQPQPAAPLALPEPPLNSSSSR